MVQFVLMPIGPKDEVRAVNPEQVRYVRASLKGGSVLVFGAFEGGLDSIECICPEPEAVAILQGDAIWTPPVPAQAEPAEGDSDTSGMGEHFQPATGLVGDASGEDDEGEDQAQTSEAAGADDGEDDHARGRRGRSK